MLHIGRSLSLARPSVVVPVEQFLYWVLVRAMLTCGRVGLLLRRATDKSAIFLLHAASAGFAIVKD